MIKATFVMEQHIGHRSFYENLHRFIEQVPDIKAAWVPVTYEDPASIWGRLPKIPGKLRGTLIGRDQVRQGLSENPGDIILFNTQVPAVLAGSALKGKPYLICTDITPIQYDAMGEQYGHQPDQGGFLSQYKFRRNQEVFRQASRVLPWSHWTAKSLKNEYGLEPERIEVIPPGVDLEKWRPGDKESTHPMRILFVGGDLYRKGGKTLLEAFRALPAGLAELVLVTRTNIVSETGIIVHKDLHPNSEELINLYRTCDVFVLPTYAEAFGIAAIEACASGLPVIATAVGGLTDIVLDQQTGFLIKPGDDVTLAKKLLTLANDPNLRQKLGLRARVLAEECFDAKKNAARVAQVLRQSVSAG